MIVEQLRLDAETVDEICTANDNRAAFARLLASLYLYEPTAGQIESFAHLGYPDDGSTLARGYAAVHEYLRHRSRATRQELAVDYAHTFLGAGVYDEIMAPPYESVFTSRQRLLMQVARDGALKYYRSEGLDLPEDNTTPEDHLGFELQFVAEMVDRSSAALRAGELERFGELVAKQRSFLRFHQENWLPDFCDAVDEYCRTGFYHGVADLTRGYLEVERQVLDELSDMLGLDPEEVELRVPWADEDEEADENSIFSLSAFEKVRSEAKQHGAVAPEHL